MSATIGTALLGRYRLDGVIGRGGMADVHRATDTTLDRVVAVKVIQHPHASDQTFLERFRREAKLVAGLDHPNVLPVWDYGEDDGRPFLVMPYVDGGTLQDRVRAGRLEMDDVRSVVAQVGAALDAAHAAGILHRDIKPANVLIDGDGRAILADFGIARSAGQATTLTAAGTVIGTPTYMAPELAQGGSASRASDLYALAAMTWEMIAGAPPFEGENPLSVLHQHVTRPVPTLKHRAGVLAPALDAFFRVAMAKRPGDRPASGADFASGFAAASSGIHTAVTRPMRGPAPGATLSLDDATVPVGSAARALGATGPAATVRAAREGGSPADAAPRGRSVSPLAVVAGGVLLLMVASALVAGLAGREGQSAEPAMPPRAEAAAAPTDTGRPQAPASAASTDAAGVTGASPTTRTGAPSPAAPTNERVDAVPARGADVPRFAIPALHGDVPRELAERIARPERMDTAAWAEIARSAAAWSASGSPDGWSALVETWAAGAQAFERGDERTAAAALDAIREAVTARGSATPGVLGMIATDGATHDPWEMALAFGDPRGDGLAAVDRALAADPDDPRALLGRSLLLHMHGDHRGAARDAGRAHDVAPPGGRAAAADLALLAAAEYEEASLAVDAAGWYERAATYGGRAAERAVARGVPLLVRELGDRERALGLVRTACTAGVAAACDRLDGARATDRAPDARTRPRPDARRRRR